jgi:hypothetical protein
MEQQQSGGAAVGDLSRERHHDLVPAFGRRVSERGVTVPRGEAFIDRIRVVVRS